MQIDPWKDVMRKGLESVPDIAIKRPNTMKCNKLLKLEEMFGNVE